MNKPTSRCIDIRQEHLLLDKFKEWFNNMNPDCDFKTWSLWGMKFEDSYIAWFEIDKRHPEIITLDQRREWFGKEYYEGQTTEKESVRDGRLDFISDFKSKLDELNKDMPGSYYGGDSLNLIQVMNILSNYNIVKK